VLLHRVNGSPCCDRKSRAAYAQSYTLWQQATIEFTCHDHSLGTLVIMFNRSHVNIGRASTPRSLFYCFFAPHISIVLFFTHIPFVVNHTIKATPPERLQQHPLLFTTNRTNRTLFVWRLNSAWPSHPGLSTILLTCLSLCNTQARAVNLIYAVLCDDEGVTQAHRC